VDSDVDSDVDVESLELGDARVAMRRVEPGGGRRCGAVLRMPVLVVEVADAAARTEEQEEEEEEVEAFGKVHVLFRHVDVGLPPGAARTRAARTTPGAAKRAADAIVEGQRLRRGAGICMMWLSDKTRQQR